RGDDIQIGKVGPAGVLAVGANGPGANRYLFSLPVDRGDLIANGPGYVDRLGDVLRLGCPSAGIEGFPGGRADAQIELQWRLDRHLFGCESGSGELNDDVRPSLDGSEVTDVSGNIRQRRK